MGPPVGGKRKRPERGYSDDQSSNRPSPHRPQNLGLAHPGYQSNDRDYNQQRGRGPRRPSRGGRGANTASSPMNSPGERPPTLTQTPVSDLAPINANTDTSTMPDSFLQPAILSDPPPEPQPYNYTYLTTEICGSWGTGGKEDVQQQGLEGIQEEQGTRLVTLMQELVQAAVFGRLSPLDAGNLVKQMLESKISDDKDDSVPHPTPVQATLLDSVSVMFENHPDIPLDRLLAFVFATRISHELLRHELDASLLEKFGMIRNTFSRMGIRKQTNLLYRQANFNLMREESEGFAKLITELFTTSSNEAPTANAVEETVEKVKAMIGAFDLDVGRSLDVVLDVFSAVLVKQCRFFVKFLRSSPWWPRSSLTKKSPTLTGLPLWALPGSSEWHLTEEQKQLISEDTTVRDEAFWSDVQERGIKAFYALGGTRPSREQVERASSSGDESLTQWIQETGTLPAPGNRDAAQLLGFKLRFYSSSPARDETDVLPDNLIYLSALLIKIGFVSLTDLYPHIWRTDDVMDELKDQKIAEKGERERAARPGAGVRNALATAGALADDTLPLPPRLKESTTRANTPSREPEAAKPAAKENDPVDQKVLLLKSLLAIGALPEALFILGRFPWLMDLIPELPEYIHRILHHSLSKVYGEVQPLQNRTSLQSQKPTYETDVPGFPKGQVKVAETTERRVLRWAQLDRNDSPDGTDYRFYWDEWNDNIPVCQNVDDVFTLCKTFLPLVGVKIGQDVGILLKFARIGKHSLHNDKSESNRSRWLDLIKRILLPSLSLTKSNAGVVNEVFELVSLFPVSVRYLMYLEWSSGRTSRNPDVKAAFDQAKAETKDILKRISKTNVRPMARSLARIAFANPHIVISTALTQIEVYDSIAEVFVEGARYFTDLGYDVLTWAIVSSMAKTGRNRTQDGGIFASRWLSALSVFAGNIYKRYGMMKPGPILQYVAEQLDKGNTTDMKMLEQIVMSMAGIATDTSYNDAQLQAMGGGPMLQGQIILQLLDRRHDSKKTAERLMKSLQDTGLAAKFLISMAQQRQAVVFEDAEVPLKAIGNTYDEVHRVMVQYFDLLRTNLSTDEFRETVPDVVSLLADYEIPPEIAFWISRSLISRQILDYDTETRKDQQGDKLKNINGDVDMSDQINGDSEEDGEAAENEAIATESPAADETMASTPDLEAGGRISISSESAQDDCWHPVMKDLMSAMQPSLPDEVVEVIGTGFYATFWQLSSYEIVVPVKAYQDEKSRLLKKKDLMNLDRTDISVSGTKKKELAKNEIDELVKKLAAEVAQHMKANLDAKSRLQREKQQWFHGKTRMDKALNTALIEHCFLPRMLSSPIDAYFCFKFLKLLHGGGTPNFRTLGFYDLFFRTSRLISLIFMCTSKEADNLGKFLNEILKDLARWHGSKATYEREGCGTKQNLPGFAMKIEAGKVVSLLDYENFQKILFKWHNNLFTALQKCLTSLEYMHVRNAISILRAISTIYPAVNWHGTGLQKVVDKLRDSDKEDLKVSSQALLGALHRREKDWVEQSKFRKGPEKKGETEPQIPQPKGALSQPAVPVNPNATEKESVEAANDEAVTDKVPKSETQPILEQKDTQLPSRISRLHATAESFKPSPKPAARQLTTSGTSTPSSRQGTDSLPALKREPRPPRPDLSKGPELPRRLTPPPPLRTNPAGLPSRPDPTDTRNGPRDNARQPNRAEVEPSRPSTETRPNHGRDSRPGYRGSERQDHAFEEYERRSRYDRPEGPPHPGREERGYGREHERRGPYDRPPPTERDRPGARLPPAERDRESREPGPRSRPPPSSESSKLDPLASQKKEAQSEPSINPARASLIEGGDQRPPARGHPLERPPRSSQPSSPRRDDERKPNFRRDADDRPRPESANARQSHGTTPAEPAPSALRSVPPGPPRRDAREARDARESREPRQPANVDMQHGRLEQEPAPRVPPSQSQDRQQESEVPSGPRGRPPSSHPTPRTRAPQLNTQVPPTASAERPTPTGPSRRQHTRSNSYADAPPTPGTPAGDSAGVHPSRLSQIDAATSEPSRPAQTSQAPQSNQPPAGPRNAAPPGAPSGPSPTSRAPPSGPHSGEASGRGGRPSRNQLSGINSTLAQAGTSVRGRGGSRQASANFGPHMPPPPPPPGGPPPPSNHGPNANGYPPNDLFESSNPNELPVGNRPSSRHDNNRGDRRTDLAEERGSERRPSRHSSRQDDARGEREHRSERDGREAKDERYNGGDSSRREERPSRRGDNPPPADGDERRGGGHPRSGPRDEPLIPRKHGRDEDPSSYGRGSGSGSGGGRGGSRVASEKRVRRGP